MAALCVVIALGMMGREMRMTLGAAVGIWDENWEWQLVDVGRTGFFVHLTWGICSVRNDFWSKGNMLVTCLMFSGGIVSF